MEKQFTDFLEKISLPKIKLSRKRNKFKSPLFALNEFNGFNTYGYNISMYKSASKSNIKQQKITKIFSNDKFSYLTPTNAYKYKKMLNIYNNKKNKTLENNIIYSYPYPYKKSIRKVPKKINVKLRVNCGVDTKDLFSLSQRLQNEKNNHKLENLKLNNPFNELKSLNHLLRSGGNDIVKFKIKNYPIKFLIEKYKNDKYDFLNNNENSATIKNKRRKNYNPLNV